MRILVLIAIGLLLYVVIGSLLRRNRTVPPKSIAGKMVKCKHCNLHILEQEALRSGDAYYCSKEHLESDK
jgi:uncharacterized protein